jgi:CRP/FNR family cyclic AMP-dependent transcriptional regulator
MDDLLAKIPLFQELDAMERAALSRCMVTRRFPKNTIVILDGDDSDSLYLIQSGKIKVFLNDDAGKEVILNYQAAGEYFGEMALLDDQPRSASVQTVEPSELAILPKADFVQCISEHPNIAMVIIQHLSGRMRVLTDKVKSLALLDVYGRVKQTLLDLSEQQDGQRVVHQRLTQQELANMIGASREMVTRILKDLTTGGYIETNNKRIVIKRNLPSAW